MDEEVQRGAEEFQQGLPSKGGMAGAGLEAMGTMSWNSWEGLVNEGESDVEAQMGEK